MWEPLPDWSTSTESWLAGGPHHTVLTTAIGAEPLADSADMTRTELLVIDDATTTTVGAFDRELRWNDAHHHLAAGL